MERIVLDTDVSSRSIKDNLPPSLRARLGTAQFSITFVTLGELTQWATFRDWGPSNRARLGRWLANKAMLPYSEDVARKWENSQASLFVVADLASRWDLFEHAYEQWCAAANRAGSGDQQRDPTTPRRTRPRPHHLPDQGKLPGPAGDVAVSWTRPGRGHYRRRSHQPP